VSDRGDRRRRNGGTALALVGVVVGMAGLTAASVPLYRLFCQVTGYGGTTQRAEQAPPAAAADDRWVTVRFNADTVPDLPWAFQPVQREVRVRLGEERLAFYRARNHAEREIFGQATFNVTPQKVGVYFAKVHCFCFEKQGLGPGEEVDMPVSFFVDPRIADDPDTSEVKTITLSYTFFRHPDDPGNEEEDDVAIRGDAAAGGAARVN
jgi:cytochrome c oxidase assembly protein subunit 11